MAVDRPYFASTAIKSLIYGPYRYKIIDLKPI